MKKVIIIISAIIFLAGCKKEEELSLSIKQSPVGGSQVDALSASFEGKILSRKPQKTFTVTVEWWWENSYHGDQTMQKSEQFAFNSNSYQTKSTVYQAPAGYILMNYYWIKLIWTDDNGSHILESGKGYCTN
ncbi:MAG TPA: hypothetical protein PKW80_06560 [Bacteroidales bacterium]|nr:hypothetical protein [Bacteroidales bacterium]